MELEGRYHGKFYDLDEVNNSVLLPEFDPPAPLALDPLLDAGLAKDWPHGRSIW